jgi:hypothetical protein
MPTVQSFPAGGYRFISHQFQYSGGVAAEPGFRVERARFARPLPLAEGFDAIEAYLAGIGRSPTAFCACELRSPAQFTDAGFVAFNRHYVERLAAWGIFRDEVNPVARSNVCPEINPPTTPSFYAFSYTVPSANSAARSFVAAGSGKAREGGPSYEGRIIRRGDQSSEAMCEKARFVLGAMEQRMAALGFGWADVTAAQVYTIFDIHLLMATMLRTLFAFKLAASIFGPGTGSNLLGRVRWSCRVRHRRRPALCVTKKLARFACV